MPGLNSYQPSENKVTLHAGVSIFPSQAKAMDRVVSELAERSLTAFVLVTDVSGQLVTSKGDSDKRHLLALAALVAEDLAAGQEIGRITGEYKSCQLALREGEKFNTFIAEAGLFLVVFILLAREVPLGWARMLIQEAARHIAEIISTPSDEISNLKIGLDDENLQNIIGDAFDTHLQE
jgi:predicted regulator of Ras-like GTPase activity (Roadblock/LC7/MglB family)